MTQWSTPPPVARWLLEYALPTDVRESVTGDLDEVFQRDCRRYGLSGARRRYWRQTMSFTLYFVGERWRDRRRGSLMRMGLPWLDVKLGFRMLSRYPMLTVVGSLAMAVAIAVGAGTFEVITRVGAQISNVVANVFRGPFVQVAMGIAVGCAMMGALVAVSMRDSDVGIGTVIRHAALLFGYGTIYFNPSLLPAESSSIDSRMRLSRVSGRLAM